MCEEGQLFPQVNLETVTYQGHLVTVNYDSTTCSLFRDEHYHLLQAKSSAERIATTDGPLHRSD